MYVYLISEILFLAEKGDLLIFCALDDPEHDPSVKGDPYKTLFVSRLSYEVKDTDLEREFGRFGPIERVRFSSLSTLLLFYFLSWQ